MLSLFLGEQWLNAVTSWSLVVIAMMPSSQLGLKKKHKHRAGGLILSLDRGLFWTVCSLHAKVS